MGKVEKDFLKMLKKLLKEGQSITGAFGIPPKILGFSVTYLQKGAACDVSTSF